MPVEVTIVSDQEPDASGWGEPDEPTLGGWVLVTLVLGIIIACVAAGAWMYNDF